MKSFLSGMFFICMVALSGASFACSEPAQPAEFPDVATAVAAQMVKANNDMKAYVRAMEKYIGCAGMSRRDEVKAFEKLEAYTESFNKLVRKFKSRKG